MKNSQVEKFPKRGIDTSFEFGKVTLANTEKGLLPDYLNKYKVQWPDQIKVHSRWIYTQVWKYKRDIFQPFHVLF